MPLVESIAQVGVAIAGSAAAAYILSAAWPFRKARNETWWHAYFRLYYNPGSALVTAGYLWGVALGMDFAEAAAGWVYAAAIAWLLLLAGLARFDRQDLHSGARMDW